MAASVQRQIRGQRNRLEETLQAASVSDADLAREFGRMGQLLMAAESVTASESYFRRARLLDPTESRWPYYLGHVHRMLGESEPAARYFEQALALRPEDVASLVWLGNAYLEQGHTEQAVPMYQRALELRPGLFAALFGLGRSALVRGSYDQATSYLEAARAAEPRASAVHYPLAVAYRELGRLAEAESHLRLRGEYEPGPPDPLMQEVAGLLESSVLLEGQGDRALALGNASAAAASFRRGLDLSPDRPALKQKLATSLALAGDVPAALELYQQLLEQDPNFAEAHYSLGALFLGSGRLDLAIQRFSAAVRADPTYLHARLQLAHALRRHGELQSAMVEYQGALTIDPRMAEARLGYAISLANLGRYATARAWLLEGRRSHPDRPEFSEALVRLLAAAPDDNVRDGRLALTLARSLVIQSRSWGTLEALAMALAEAGHYGEAVVQQREALEAYRRASDEPNVSMAENLRRYERREPCRIPWTVDPI